MLNRVTIEVPCQLAFRDVAGMALRRACVLAKSGEEQTSFEYHVISAFNEAFNNITEHACADGERTESVKLIIQYDSAALELQILSFGDGFENNTPVKPDLESLPESGMGLFIMESFMDEVEFTHGQDDGPNVVRMKKVI